MNIKTTLIYPSPTRHTSPPLGVGYIAAVLRENGFDVNIIDFNDIKDKDDFIKKIKMYNPDLVGFSVQTNFADTSFEYAKLVKELLPNALIAFGGPHPSVLPEDTLKRPYVDVIAIGEAEYTFLDIVKALEKNKPLGKVKGIWYKNKDIIKKNKRREFIQDLDELPYPARDLLPMHIYLRNVPPPPMYMPYTHLMANRGCPYQCRFCQPTSHIMFGLKLRYRHYTKVVDEVEFLRNKYKLGCINIGGDTLTVDKKWVKNFCDEMIKRKVNLPWIAGIRVDTVNYAMLKDMKKAGCIMVTVGAESGSQFILDKLGKGIKVQQTIDCFNWLNKAGITAAGNFMIGNPGETRETLEETLRIIKKIKLDFLNCYITNPLPGTHLYDDAIEQDLIKAKRFSDLSRHHLGSMKLDNLTDAEVESYRDKFYREFVKLRLSYIFNPLLFFKKLHLHKIVLRRLISLRHMNFNAITKSYKYLQTTKKKPIDRIVEMIIKSM